MYVAGFVGRVGWLPRGGYVVEAKVLPTPIGPVAANAEQGPPTHGTCVVYARMIERYDVV